MSTKSSSKKSKSSINKFSNLLPKTAGSVGSFPVFWSPIPKYMLGAFTINLLLGSSLVSK